MRFQFHPAADAEFNLAVEYYEQQQNIIREQIYFISINSRLKYLPRTALFFSNDRGIEQQAVCHHVLHIPGDVENLCAATRIPTTDVSTVPACRYRQMVHVRYP